MTILLETDFEIGDMVCHKTDREEKFIVLSYYIMGLDKSGVVSVYNVDCGCGTGEVRSFKPFELEIVEKVNAKNK